jgi:hypothetical protein
MHLELNIHLLQRIKRMRPQLLNTKNKKLTTKSGFKKQLKPLWKQKRSLTGFWDWHQMGIEQLNGAGWALFMRTLRKINSTNLSSQGTYKSWGLIALKH